MRPLCVVKILVLGRCELAECQVRALADFPPQAPRTIEPPLTRESRTSARSLKNNQNGPKTQVSCLRKKLARGPHAHLTDVSSVRYNNSCYLTQRYYRTAATSRWVCVSLLTDHVFPGSLGYQTPWNDASERRIFKLSVCCAHRTN